MKIYNAEGIELENNLEKFIAEYEKYYFMPEGTDEKSDSAVNKIYVDGEKIVRINGTKKAVEDKIISILNHTGEKTVLDVKYIMAWKVGAIDMKKSDEICIRYRAELDWGEDREIKDEVCRPQYTNDKFYLKGLTEFVCENGRDIEFKGIETTEVLDFITAYCDEKAKKSQRLSSVGIVYMITLLHFLTCGAVPIYDKYVHIALKAILWDKRPGEPVYYAGPADNQKVTVLGLLDEYMRLIDAVLDGSAYKIYRKCSDEDIEKIRKLDRALWVYGHLFNLK